MSSPHDSDLRRLLDDAVSDVHPVGGPDAIRARGRRPSAGRWVPLALAAAVATMLVIGGTAWFAQHQTPTPPAAAPGASQAPTPKAPQSAARTVHTTVYYVGPTAGGPRLFPEVRRVPGATGSDLQVAIDQVMTARPLDPDYDGWPPDDTTATASVAGSLITIDLSGPAGSASHLAKGVGPALVQALVWTADAATSSDLPVRFTQDGKPTDQVLGVDTTQPVQRASQDSTLSPVQVSSPAQGATVASRFTVEGQAATFEANVVWELKRGAVTVRHGFTTAQECCTLAPYSFTVSAPPGDYTLVVHDTDESGGEGVGTSQDTKDITVQ